MAESGNPVSSAFRVIETLAGRVAGLRGWRRHLLAAAMGTLATLSLPPLYLFPVLFLCFPVLVWLLPGGLRRRTAFFTGWWFGLGYFAAGLYWIGVAPYTLSADLIWLVPFAALALPLGLAIFFGLAALAAAWRGKTLLFRALALALALSVTEWLRGHILTGLPWNLPGYAWMGPDSMAQGAALFGLYGMTVLVLVSAALPAVLAEGSRRRRVAAAAVALALPLAVWVGGGIRLAGVPEVGADLAPGIGLRLVQANIPQREKWDRRLLRRNFNLLRTLSMADRPDWITHVIWPETATPFNLTGNPEARRAAATIVPPGGMLLTGVTRREGGPPRIWNSMVAVDDNAEIAGIYDKFHLVPFGEYMPLASILPFGKITAGALNFSAGPGPLTLRLEGLPAVGPLICYEVIFPGRVVDAHDRPLWLLNLTNDAWYGMTAGPHQHLAIARARSIEEGLPLVRSANTGISAVYDAYGREISRLGLNQTGVIDVLLPAAAPAPPPYAGFGDSIMIPLLILLVLPLLLESRNY
ncbi:MAG: apolipoprotein N-acyltransferase [Alphaproteobacteria bacterium]